MKSSWCLLCISILALGLPGSLSSSNATFWTQRTKFLAQERNNSLGGKWNLTEDEEKANKVLMAAKIGEISKGFKNLTTFLPSRNFMTVIQDIQASPTFQIIQKMPKGAVLHAHDTAFASLDYIYENITFRDNLYVCRPEGAAFSYRFMNSSDDDTSCTASEGWELLADLRANETIADDVNTQVRQSLTTLVSNPESIFTDVNAAWGIAIQVFGTLQSLLTYAPVWSDYYYQGLYELYQDNVFYLELRTTLPTLYDLEGNTYDELAVAEIYAETTACFIADYPDFIGAKLIYAPIRRVTSDQMDVYVETLISLTENYPDLIAGFDLVGPEDGGKALIEFADQLQTISEYTSLILHAGETKWSGLTVDENVIDAVYLNATRIGHGDALLKHPYLLNVVKQRQIAVEVNPISNMLLILINDMRNHPASFLFAENYPVVVSCDDPALWGAVGLSYDFYEAFVGIMPCSADIRALKKLAKNSIMYSTLSTDDKAVALELWKEQWETFVSDVAADYDDTLSSNYTQLCFNITEN